MGESKPIGTEKIPRSKEERLQKLNNVNICNWERVNATEKSCKRAKLNYWNII